MEAPFRRDTKKRFFTSPGGGNICVICGWTKGAHKPLTGVCPPYDYNPPPRNKRSEKLAPRGKRTVADKAE